jgi:penicillin-binding protein 1C
MVATSWFILPPLMEYYFKNTNASYRTLPPYRSDCDVPGEAAMDFIYPKENGTITLPRNFNGKPNELIISIVHAKPETMVFWYMDETYLGQTQTLHEIAVLPKTGVHNITALDALGNEIRRTLTIIN